MTAVSRPEVGAGRDALVLRAERAGRRIAEGTSSARVSCSSAGNCTAVGTLAASRGEAAETAPPASAVSSAACPQAGTLAIMANCAPSGSSATANLPTPGMSLGGTTTVPPPAVTAAAAASQSGTSK